jgi:8-oxo-dGTP diphosphatase
MLKPTPSRGSAAPILVAAAALIDASHRVLVQARPPSGDMAGLWEFPGGKVEPGERPETALARELAEELAIVIDPADAEPIGFVSTPVGERHMILLLYAVRAWQGAPELRHATALRWMLPSALHALAMPPPDRPLIAALEKLLA